MKPSVIILDEREHTKDRYMPETHIRVSPDNATIKPQKLSLVVVSVGYGEYLSQTLPKNAPMFDEVVVVCGYEHEKLFMFESDWYAPNVQIFVRGEWRSGNSAFNKGAMLNAGLAALKNPDWILFTDADIILHPDTGSFIRSHVLNPGVMYFTSRVESSSPEHINKEPNGYFELWNRRAFAIRDRWPAVMSENFCSAGGVDSWFSHQWPDDKTCYLPQLPVTHLDHGGKFAGNWNGREPRHGTWRQIGCINANGIPYVLPDYDGVKRRLRLTDHRYAQQVELEVGQSWEGVIGNNGNGGLTFLGKDIGLCSIHVAAWFE